MSIQVTVNKSFYSKLEAIEEEAKEKAIELGQEVVSFAVGISPVDTGAYVESFSVVPRGSSGGRSRTSKNRPKASNPEGVRGEAIGRLRSSVVAIDPNETGGFTLINRSPHARAVEYKHGYLVFEQTRNRFS